MRVISLILTLLIVLIGIAFTALNAKTVSINYLIGVKELPLAVITLIAFFIGIFLSILMMGVNMLKLKAKNKWLESKLKHAQERAQVE